jgi:hypothetical protein
MTIRTDLTRHRGPVRLSAVGAVTAALALATLGIATTAAAGVPGPHIEKPLTQAHAAASPDAAGSSTYLAGYRDAPAGGLASASVTFTVPTYTCTPAEERFGSLEANGVYTDSLSAFAFVGAACSGSGVSYDYFFDVGSANFGESGAAAGDVIVASLFESSSSTFVKIHDLTNGEFWDTDQPSNLGDSVVDLGTFNEETISGLRLTNFKKVAFTNATVNGDDLGFESPSAVNALNGGDLLLQTGGISTTATGSAFSVKFKAAS